MRHATLVLLLALGTGCGDSLYLEGGVSQLCQRLSGQRFVVPQLPAAIAQLTLTKPITVERTFAFDITAQLPPALSNSEIAIALDTMTLTPGQGTPDLSFIDGAQVTLEPPPASTLPKQVVVRQATSPSTLSFDGQDLELYPYLKDGVLSYTVALTASAMPPSDVSADIAACANVSVRWDYAR